jgi:type IV pilus assembly protein PilF
MSLRRLIPLVMLLCLPLSAGAERGSKKDRSMSRGELGRAYLAEGSLESAIGALREAVELDRTNWSAWTFLGLALAEKGKPEDAEKAFLKAVKLADDRAEPHLNYGLFLFGQGRVDEAIVQYEAAVEDLTYRKPAFVLNNMGFALMAKGDNERAVTVLRQAVERAPHLCPARFNLGLALEGTGDDTAALAAYKDVVETCGDQVPGAYLQVGRLMLEQGRDDEAATWLFRVVDLVPESDAAQAARELLASLQ